MINLGSVLFVLYFKGLQAIVFKAFSNIRKAKHCHTSSSHKWKLHVVPWVWVSANERKTWKQTRTTQATKPWQLAAAKSVQLQLTWVEVCDFVPVEDPAFSLNVDSVFGLELNKKFHEAFLNLGFGNQWVWRDWKPPLQPLCDQSWELYLSLLLNTVKRFSRCFKIWILYILAAAPTI